MKKIVKLSMVTTLSINAFFVSYSQDDSGAESYMKSNVSLTKFKVLGVNGKQYAKCLESVNYLDADKRLKFVFIEKTDFVDDGTKYDLVANDGIMTSTTLFAYDARTIPIRAGTYQNSSSHDSFVFDESFVHQDKTGSAGKFIFKCKIKWVPCSQMSNPAQQYLCNWAGWPYGSFMIKECEIGWEI